MEVTVIPGSGATLQTEIKFYTHSLVCVLQPTKNIHRYIFPGALEGLGSKEVVKSRPAMDLGREVPPAQEVNRAHENVSSKEQHAT